jgi:hypothetical protein
MTWRCRGTKTSGVRDDGGPDSVATPRDSFDSMVSWGYPIAEVSNIDLSQLTHAYMRSSTTAGIDDLRAI